MDTSKISLCTHLTIKVSLAPLYSFDLYRLFYLIVPNKREKASDRLA